MLEPVLHDFLEVVSALGSLGSSSGARVPALPLLPGRSPTSGPTGLGYLEGVRLAESSWLCHLVLGDLSARLGGAQQGYSGSRGRDRGGGRLVMDWRGLVDWRRVMDDSFIHMVITDIVVTHWGREWLGWGRTGGGPHVKTWLWYRGALGVDHMVCQWLLTNRTGRTRTRTCLVSSSSSYS